MLPNAGEKAMAIGSQKIPTLIEARIAQQKMKEETKICTLDNAADDIDVSSLHGGPSLREIISGMQHPYENRPLFLSIDQLPAELTSYVVACRATDGTLAFELLSRIAKNWKPDLVPELPSPSLKALSPNKMRILCTLPQAFSPLLIIFWAKWNGNSYKIQTPFQWSL